MNKFIHLLFANPPKEKTKQRNLLVLIIVVLILFILIPSLNAQNIGINATGASPDNSAILDVNAAPANDKGLLIPRVALTATNSNLPIGVGIATSLLVYNTATAGILPNNVLPGYYYWDGTKWVALSGGTGGNDWSLLGNAGTNPATNFIGTTDAQDWVIKTNNTEKIRVLSNGNLGVGTVNPIRTLHVVSPVSDPEQIVWERSGTSNQWALASDASRGLIQNLTTPSVIPITFLNGGNVGIGTTTPVAKLDILGNIKIVDGTQGVGKVLTSDAAGLASWAIPTGGGGSSWDLLGNAGTVAGTNFLGTTDAQALVIKTSNIERIRVASTGEVGISNIVPMAPIHLLDIDVSGGFFNDAINVVNEGFGKGIFIWQKNTGGASSPAGQFWCNNNAQSGYFANFSTSFPTATPVVQVRRRIDGQLINFSLNGIVQGNISVTGATVSYNAFTGSHYGWLNNEKNTNKLQTGMLMVMNGNNKYTHNNTEHEIIYGITLSTIANDPTTLGAYLGYAETDSAANTTIHLIMAVGNGVMWVVDNGQDLTQGDYLISSDVTGHAMKDNGQYEVSYIVAKAAEPVKWSEISETINGIKHKKISVLFEVFKQENLAVKIKNLQIENEKLKAEVSTFKTDLEKIKQFINLKASK